MNRVIFITQLIHKLAIIALLTASALIPFITEVNLVAAFVYFPLLLIISFILSLAVEHQISKIKMELPNLDKVKKTSKNTSRCLIKRGLCCLHS